jgi:A/G-specific adenine glycosylase
MRVKPRREKIRFFEIRLRDFFRKAGRSELPWRRPGLGAYEVFVSEIMLQQTQASRVISYYERFLGRFPTVEKLAAASWEAFLPYYEGLGYYARGRNMLKTAQAVVSEYGGRFPKTKEALMRLPGIGPYTASAIASFAYGKKHLAWDTNLKRVFGRFFYGGKEEPLDEAFFEGALTLSRRSLNAALMDFGSLICTARPKCGACSLRERCTYFREGGRREEGSRRRVPAFRPGFQALVFLHVEHRRYYSAARSSYRPFLVPEGSATRTGIKAYFKERYGLSLSVRPPFAEASWRGRDTLLVNAQVLLGEPRFPVFSKAEAKRYTEGISG